MAELLWGLEHWARGWQSQLLQFQANRYFHVACAHSTGCRLEKMHGWEAALSVLRPAEPHNSVSCFLCGLTVSSFIIQNPITGIKKNHVWKDSVSLFKSLTKKKNGLKCTQGTNSS